VLNIELEKRWGVTLANRTGVNTGTVIASSEAGTRQRLVTGDTVNVAARLEVKSKELGWPVVASLATVDAAGFGANVEERREVALAGRDASIIVARIASHAAGPKPRIGGAVSTGMAAMLDQSALATAAAAKEALDRTLHALSHQLVAPSKAQEPMVNGYRVLAKIAEGGMSSVYLAEEQAGSRKVVLKVLKGCRGDDENLWRRFFQECAILSAINHDHVVRIYDQGFGEELAYIAMEYLGGGTLRDLIARGLSPRQALSLLSQAASGLAEIHRCGIVHRDVKPPNLMLRTEGVLVLTDFGVAKRLDGSAGHTLPGEVLGTPYYLSPEQAQDAPITARADLYSLGVIFYEMLTGLRPYRGDTILEVIAQHISAPIPRLPEELGQYQRIVDGLLAKRPEDRFVDADALLGEIDAVWTQQALLKVSAY
jgi:serine/threonine-protein kinase PpkA